MGTQQSQPGDATPADPPTGTRAVTDRVSVTPTRGESSVVTLPAAQAVIFPEACVSCLGPAETARKHWGVRLGWWQVAVPIALPAGAHWVPYCKSCARRTRRRLITIRVFGFPLFFVAMIVSILLAKSMPGVGSLWLPVALGLSIALVFPVLLWGAAWRPPFDSITRGRTIECRFRNAAYAREFERLNIARRDAQPRELELVPASLSPAALEQCARAGEENP